MTTTAKLLLGAGLFALAACDQSGVGGGGGGGNGAAPSAAETAAEAESDPANTLENQAAALAEDTGEAAPANGADEADAAAENGAEANAADNRQ